MDPWLPARPPAGSYSPYFTLVPQQSSVHSGATEAASPCQSGGWRLCCYVSARSVSICTLTVCLAATAGLYKLITVNCVPPLHNQLMFLRTVRCATEVCVRCSWMPTVFNMRLNVCGLKSILIFTMKDPELIFKVNLAPLRVIQQESE